MFVGRRRKLEPPGWHYFWFVVQWLLCSLHTSQCFLVFIYEHVTFNFFRVDMYIHVSMCVLWSMHFYVFTRYGMQFVHVCDNTSGFVFVHSCVNPYMKAQ